MKIAIAADHGGFPLKADLVELLKQAGHEPIDLGAHEYIAGDDYPDYALLVGQAIQSGQAERGIVICGSGVGACIAANKMKGIRAGVCHDTYSAHQGVEHDDMNVHLPRRAHHRRGTGARDRAGLCQRCLQYR